MINQRVQRLLDKFNVKLVKDLDFKINQNQYVIENDEIIKLRIENTKNFNIEDFEIICDELLALQILVLSNNNIDRLPDDFSSLINLELLNLSNNNIDRLPDDFSSLINLELLNLSNNNIDRLPDDLSSLINLKGLYLSNNNIDRLPDDFSSLTNLLGLDLSNNPILANINISEYDALSTKEQIEYLLKIQNSKTIALNELKIIVVGDENVGKTKIITRYKDNTYNGDRDKTTGIDIQSIKLKNGLKANIWDFAGQEIAHQTHHYFMSSRSLYILVLTSQTEDDETKLYKWLNTIKTYSKESQIIIVVNQIDKNYKHITKEKYQDEFRVVDVCYVSALSGEGFGIFDDMINKYSKTVENINQPIPENWIKVKEWLEKKNNNNDGYIEQSMLKYICKKDFELKDDKEIELLLSILHSIGTIVKYEQSIILKQLHILNPKWISSVLYTIIEKSKLSLGKFTKSDFQNLLDELNRDGLQYQLEHFDWIKDLIIKYEAGFELNDDEILIPLALEDTPPKTKITKNLNLRYSYKEFLRKNVISQFIVKIQHYIDYTQDIPYYKSGVMMIHDSAKAIAVANYNTKTIDINIQTNNDDGIELLTIIRDKFREIHKGMSVDEQIPLIHNQKIIDYKNYKFIKNLKDKGRKKYEFQVGDDLVELDINDLLKGYDIEYLFYKKIKDELINIASNLVKRKINIKPENENQINDRVLDMLSISYIVQDQSRGGVSENQKDSGERDFVIIDKENRREVAIIEGYILDSFTQKKMNTHYDKLRNKYDPVGNEYKYMLVYIKKGTYADICNQYIKKYNLVMKEEKDNIKCGLSDDGAKIYHILINLTLPKED